MIASTPPTAIFSPSCTRITASVMAQDTAWNPTFIAADHPAAAISRCLNPSAATHRSVLDAATLTPNSSTKR